MQEGEESVFLREQAAKCRRLADSILDNEAAATLRMMAEDYDAKADALDAAINAAPKPRLDLPPQS
jgi:hypothetical protein